MPAPRLRPAGKLDVAVTWEPLDHKSGWRRKTDTVIFSSKETAKPILVSRNQVSKNDRQESSAETRSFLKGLNRG